MALMVFTVFGQCVVGGFIVLALALMTGKLSREQEQRVVGSMFGLWVLMGIGFIASTMHLGSPLRAFNSLNRVGASSLSNEIASGAIFFAVGGIGWLLAVCKKLPAGLRSLWLVVTMVLGVIFVWMMVRVYNTIDTVPTWYTVWTPLSFFLTLFIAVHCWATCCCALQASMVGRCACCRWLVCWRCWSVLWWS